MHRMWFTSALLLLSVVQVACNSNEMLGSAPDFSSLEEKESETQSIMQVLAISISRIEDATVRDLTIEERRLAVDTQLEVIEELSELLATQSTNNFVDKNHSVSHDIINNNIGAFLTQVRQARSQLRKNPPNYFVAGKVAGHCQMCHQQRDAETR